MRNNNNSEKLSTVTISAIKVLNELTTGLRRIGDHKIVNLGRPAHAVHVCFEGLWRDYYPMFTVAQMKLTAGALLTNPEMTFILADRWIPIRFEIEGVFEFQSVFLQDDMVVINPVAHKEMIETAENWLAVVAQQQGFDRVKELEVA